MTRPPDLLKAAGGQDDALPGRLVRRPLSLGDATPGRWTPAAGGGGNRLYIARDVDFGAFIGMLDKVGANAIITVNYGMNPSGTGPGVPQEAAAWVAYANGDPASTVAIGVDADGHDWKTVGYWAGLRAGRRCRPTTETTSCASATRLRSA